MDLIRKLGAPVLIRSFLVSIVKKRAAVTGNQDSINHIIKVESYESSYCRYWTEKTGYLSCKLV